VPDVNWFDGYEAQYVAAWGPRASNVAGEIFLSAGPQRIELDMITRVVAKTLNMDYLGRTVVLTIENHDTVGAPWFTAVFEPDAEEGLFAAFEVVGLSLGTSILSAEVI
jgi:hypothetical protein